MEQYDILLRGDAAKHLQGSRLLAYADSIAGFDGDADAWLCSMFGVEQKRFAAFGAMGDGLDAASGYWLRADPVHLALMRDFFVLHGTPADISAQHASQMVAALNLHFSASGMQWFAPAPGRWYLKLEHALEITALSKDRVRGKRVSKEMSSAHGDAVLNEIQMLLHQHDANMQREQAGLLPLNSLWLWGGGEYALPPLQPYAVAMGNEPLLKGLAGARCRPLPDSADYLPESDNGLVVLDEVDASQFEQKWATPLLPMLKNDKVQKLVLHLEQEGSVASYELRRRNLWQFWRRW